MNILFHVRDRPPRSCDLTPLDYFGWGYFGHVYTDKPTSIDSLEDNIEAFIRDKRPKCWEEYAKIGLSGDAFTDKGKPFVEL